MKVIILFGAPGSGKGSISQTLVQDYGFHQLSTGEIIRKHISEQATADKGNLVNDDCINKLVLEALKKFKEDDVVILDGYPRTQGQADFLTQHCQVDKVFLLTNISEECIIERLSNRLICRAKSHSFNLLHYAPKVPGVCDFDGSELYRRPDDEGETVKKRLAIYREHTQPLLDYYREKVGIVEIDATKGVNEMVKEIYKLI